MALKQTFKWIAVAVLVLLLGASFHYSGGWLQLCAGLALFLFGMQCLEQGLKALAGGGMERLLARSTATPLKGLLFGGGATLLLQSSTLVSLLTIAFLGTGLIQLGGAIAVLLGANLGATSGIWLLALAGQNLSLSPLALPLLVFGVLARYTGPRGMAAGQLLVGIAFIFLAIDQIKDGFSAMTTIELGRYAADGWAGTLLFVAVGLGLTVIVQSSHATLMLTLAALSQGQLEPAQSLAIAIGSNVGSSVSTAVMGFLGGNRAGQRLALAHVLFNVSTALVALLALPLLQSAVLWLTARAGMGDNALIQLALFHTLFNALGVALFWPWQAGFARLLERWLPDRPQPAGLVAEIARGPAATRRSPYLSDSALRSADTATQAFSQELRHLGRLSLEVIGQALYCPPDELAAPRHDDVVLRGRLQQSTLDSETLYREHIKPVYGELLRFAGRFEQPLDEVRQQWWRDGQEAASQLVKAVKDAHQLQANLKRYAGATVQPGSTASAAASAYLELRRQLIDALAWLGHSASVPATAGHWQAQRQTLQAHLTAFKDDFTARLFREVREGRLDGAQLGSLVNDLGYAQRIVGNLHQVLELCDGQRQGLAWRGREEDAATAPAP
ncbi:Na/Pi cotransporter family protein [Stenotrophomonas pictorum]|uniref:Na/Pi cotransporter family protein n=1 Tax=Stenotrophomonas pictorum TaxID=86184 RepID=UPI000AAB38C9